MSQCGPRSDFSGPTSGCTSCVAIMRGNQLVVANAGDSRCVISRKGEAYNLSRDHKPGLEVERDRILKAGGFIHAGRVNGSLNLTRAIGDMEFKQNKFLSAEKQIGLLVKSTVSGFHSCTIEIDDERLGSGLLYMLESVTHALSMCVNSQITIKDSMGTYLQYAALTTRSYETLSGASDMSIDLSGENEADGPKPPSNETPTPLNQTPTPSNEIPSLSSPSFRGKLLSNSGLAAGVY
ncbi:probable protein phosphatase 2C 60 [Tanacetum coccineum]|uniref:Probable protein phosphatase 2C 60 n=1 Tax=Tanacetum coccineum TaxID=301880 RepID=A0ABQ5CCD0_9ASTR